MSALPDVTPGTPGGDLPTETATASGQPDGGALTSGQPAAVAIAPQPVIPVSLLTAHPGNVRRDLDLTPDFVASIAANGVLVPLRITRGTDGAFRVIDGHRRLAAAIQAGLADVPPSLPEILVLRVFLNAPLAVFNLIPIPPLDGGNVLGGLLPARLAAGFDRVRPYGFLLLYALMLTGGLELLVAPPYHFLVSWLPTK